MADKDWNSGYKKAIKDALEVLDRANFDRALKQNLRSKFKKLLTRLKVSEPRIKLQELEV